MTKLAAFSSTQLLTEPIMSAKFFGLRPGNVCLNQNPTSPSRVTRKGYSLFSFYPDQLYNSEKFGTDLGIALKVQANLGLKFEEPPEEGEIDMCKGMELFIRKERADENVKATEKATKEATESTLLQNIRKMMKNLNMTVAQAFAALEVPASDQARLAALL